MEAAEKGKCHMSCKACGTTPERLHRCNLDEEEDVETVAQSTRSQTKKKNNQQKSIPGQESIEEHWISTSIVLPSAKTVAIKAQILNWIEKNPQVKIIVYTQFLAM